MTWSNITEVGRKDEAIKNKSTDFLGRLAIFKFAPRMGMNLVPSGSLPHELST